MHHHSCKKSLARQHTFGTSHWLCAVFERCAMGQSLSAVCSASCVHDPSEGQHDLHSHAAQKAVRDASLAADNLRGSAAGADGDNNVGECDAWGLGPHDGSKLLGKSSAVI